MPQYADLVLSNEELGIDPRMILLEELGAIFALAEEDLSSSWVHFGVFCDVIDYAFVHSPAVVVCLVLLDFLCCIKH